MSDALNKLTAESPQKAIAGIVYATQTLSQTAQTVKGQLNANCLSKNTFTK
jgi:hypothetical protein